MPQPDTHPAFYFSWHRLKRLLKCAMGFHARSDLYRMTCSHCTTALPPEGNND